MKTTNLVNLKLWYYKPYGHTLFTCTSINYPTYNLIRYSWYPFNQDIWNKSTHISNPRYPLFGTHHIEQAY